MVITQKEDLGDHTSEAKKPRAITLLKRWDFSALFLGGFINNVGSYFTYIAIVFLALNVTSHLPPEEATRAVALLTTFTLIPMLVLGPLAGVIADKYDRKKIMILADVLGGAAAFGLIFASQIWHIYLFSLFSSSVRQFFFPAKTASIPRLVEQDELLTANGFIQTSSNLSRLIGPLLAGFIVGIFGFSAAFIIDGITFIVSAGLIFSIRSDLKPPKKEERVSVRSVMTGLKEGFTLSFGDKIITFVLFVFAFVILVIGMVDPLIVPYMNFEFGVGEREYGLLMSISAISGVIAAIILSIKGQLKKKLTFMSVSIGIASFCLTFIALAPFLPGGIIWLYVGMSLVGMINVGFNIPFSTLLQTIVRNEHLGKISGVIDTVLTGASLLAATIAAALAGVISTSLIFGIVAIMIAVASIVSLILIKVMKLEKESQRRELEMKQIREMEKKGIIPSEVSDDFDDKAKITLEQLKAEEYNTPLPSVE